jgi:hypothetical protein
VQEAVLELVEQRLCGGDERSRVDRRLRVDGGGQLRRAIGTDAPRAAQAAPGSIR